MHIYIDSFLTLDINGQTIGIESTPSIKNVYDKSDAVLIVSPISRTQYDNVIESKVKINSVISGEPNNDTAYIFEHYTAYSNNDGRVVDFPNSIETFNGLPMMREENEYIVFLTREKGYWGNDRYVLTSKHYGIFPITDSFEVIQHSDVEDFNSFVIKSEEMDKVGLVTFAFDDIAMDSYNSMIQSEKTV